MSFSNSNMRETYSRLRTISPTHFGNQWLRCVFNVDGYKVFFTDKIDFQSGPRKWENYSILRESVFFEIIFES